MQLDRRLFNGKLQSSIVYPEFFPLAGGETVVNLGCGVGPQAVTYTGKFSRMVGVDLNAERLEASKILLAEHGVQNYETLCAPVEKTGLPDASFDKALAIDIIEHLPDPLGILIEAHRLLKPGGELLVSVPAMHDHYVHFAKAIAKLLGRKTKDTPHGHLDAHNSEYSVDGWLRLMAQTPMKVMRTRATTLWPPFHLYGSPRFWFTNPVLHAIDTRLCTLPVLKRFGQAYLVVLRKP
ncbi:MAG TPA: class I SAM-dependent methyltransferase [Candidatus Peribacteria bacterium]|nr:class I SAM-dependent methyltransferase [Candidatus Peribacteria bacterium]